MELLEELGLGLSPEDDGVSQLAPLSRAPHDFLSSLAGQEGQTQGSP